VACDVPLVVCAMLFMMSVSNGRPCLLTPSMPYPYGLVLENVPYVASRKQPCAEGLPHQRWASLETDFCTKT
jgi:hypothetical protein